MADISDILASVTRSANLHSHSIQSDPAEEDFRQLTRAFISERTSPELLPYPASLMDRVSTRIRAQIARIEDSTAAMQTGSSFALVVLQTELERVKWLVRSLLRARLAKIDAHTPFLLSLAGGDAQSQSQSQSQSQHEPLHAPGEPLMSPTEHAYALRHNALLEQHYARTFLSAFPPKLRRLDDRVGGGGGAAMVQGPDMDSVVFVRCLGARRDSAGQGRGGLDDDDDDDGRVIHDSDDEMNRAFGPVVVSCGYTPSPAGPKGLDMAMDVASQQRRAAEARQVMGERLVSMSRGEIWAVRWSSVRQAVARGEAELV